MRKSLVSLGAIALALLAQSAVRAEGIPWGYSAADTKIYNDPTVKTSSITFAGSSGVANGDSGVVIYNLTTSSNPTAGTTDSFNAVKFDLAVTLTDVNATSSSSSQKKASDVVNFSGLFSASNVTPKSMLPGPNSWTTPTEVVRTLGSADSGWRHYTGDITSFTPPGQPGGAPGSILATVHITDADGPPSGPPDGNPGGSGTPPSDTPEPSSLLLAALGVPMVLAARRRLKKKTELEVAA